MTQRYALVIRSERSSVPAPIRLRRLLKALLRQRKHHRRLQ
jgi:hypothetical protein